MRFELLILASPCSSGSSSSIFIKWIFGIMFYSFHISAVSELVPLSCCVSAHQCAIVLRVDACLPASRRSFFWHRSRWMLILLLHIVTTSSSSCNAVCSRLRGTKNIFIALNNTIFAITSCRSLSLSLSLESRNGVCIFSQNRFNTKNHAEKPFSKAYILWKFYWNRFPPHPTLAFIFRCLASRHSLKLLCIQISTYCDMLKVLYAIRRTNTFVLSSV